MIWLFATVIIIVFIIINSSSSLVLGCKCLPMMGLNSCHSFQFFIELNTCPSLVTSSCKFLSLPQYSIGALVVRTLSLWISIPHTIGAQVAVGVRLNVYSCTFSHFLEAFVLGVLRHKQLANTIHHQTFNRQIFPSTSDDMSYQ